MTEVAMQMDQCVPSKTVTFADNLTPGETYQETAPSATYQQDLARSSPASGARPIDAADSFCAPKQEAPSPATDNIQYPDLAYHGSVGPDVGVHTAGFRRAKYNPSEWAEASYAKFYQAFSDRDVAERTRHEGDRSMKETLARQEDTQKTTTKKLQERLKDINFWKHELERQVTDMISETDCLVQQKLRLENALRATEVPLHIATDNLNVRRRRQGVDLVQDNVELQLLKEVEIINNVQDVLRKAIEQASHQISSNRSSKQQLEMDWSDKKEANEFDGKAANLTNQSTNKQLYAGAAVFQQVQSTPESWAQFSHDNIVNAENERMASVQLRTLIDNLLEDTSRDMQEQYDTVNTAFHRRLQELEDAKYKLEENLKNVVCDIGKQEKMIADLRAAIKAKETPMAVATTRLHHRMNRPGVDLCRDDPQYQLIGEVNELNQSIDELTGSLNDATNSLKQLMDDQMQLEREISNKKNSIFIDRNKCVTHRSRYPTTLRLQGYNQ